MDASDNHGAAPFPRPFIAKRAWDCTWLRSIRAVMAASSGTRLESSLVRTCVNNAPKRASPTTDPICRKNCDALVAIPSCELGTAFWTARLKRLWDGPSPIPTTNRRKPRSIGTVFVVIAASHSNAPSMRILTKGVQIITIHTCIVYHRGLSSDSSSQRSYVRFCSLLSLT